MDKKELIKKYEKYCSSDNYLLNDEFTYSEVEKILELKQNEYMKMLFNSVYTIDNSIIAGMKKLVNDSKVQKAVEKIIYKVSRIDEFDGEILFQEINNNNFIDYLNIIDSNNIPRNITLYNLLSKFRNDTMVPNWKENPKLFNIFVNDSQKFNYILEDINNYKECRENHFINLINENHPRLLSNITSSYFGMNYNLFKEKMTNIRYMDNKMNFIKDKELFNYIDSIDKLNKEDLLEYIKNVKNLEKYFDELQLELKEISKNDIIDKINFMPISKQEIKNFEGEEFTFLVHKIKGLLKADITKKLELDISEWDKNYQDDSYISCSLIGNEKLSLTSGKYLTLGFQKINKDQILAVNNKDMLFKSKDIKAKQLDYMSNYLLAEQILKLTGCYNEIVLKRFNDNKEALKPDYVLTFDDIDARSKNASEYFKSPIYNINIEAYAEKLVEKLRVLKEKDINLYLEYINQLCSSLNSNYNDFKNYYNIIAMNINNDNKEAEEFINKVNIYKNRK